MGANAQSGATAAFEQAIAAAEGRLQAGDARAAESRYREVLFEGWLLLGTLDGLDGRIQDARAALRRASGDAGTSRAALQSLAVAELRLGDAPAAAAILAPLAKSDADPLTRRLLARALAASGQLDEAERELGAAQAAAGDDPELVFALATDYLSLKKPDPAAALFAKVLQARPLPQTHVLVGRSYRDAGEFARAQAELRAALALDPGVRRAHYYLGMVILQEGGSSPERFERAAAEFREELQLEPLDAPANDQLGVVLMETGRPEAALPFLERAARQEPRSAYLRDLGRCQLALDRPADAAASSQRALDLALDQAGGQEELEVIHFQLGRALRVLGREQEAAKHLAEAGRLADLRRVLPADGGGSQGSAASPAGESPLSGLPRAQRAELERQVSAGLARAYFNLGVLRSQDLAVTPPAERYAQAAELLQQTAELDPGFPQVQSALGIALFNARRFDAATGPLARARAVDPNDAGLRRMLATAWLNTQAYAKALELLQGDPELATSPPLRFAYGLALLRTGRAAEAVVHLEAVAQLSPEDADVHFELGRAYETLGRSEPARTQYEIARRLKSTP